MRAAWPALLLSLAACGAQPLESHGLYDAGADPPAPRPDAGDAGDGAGGGDAGDAGVAPSLGANVIPAGVVFRVWAPHATAAQVAGDFPEQSVITFWM